MAKGDRIGPWPNTRLLARRMGSLHFFTGRPCRRGHVSIRVTKTGNCLQCKREQQRPRDLERLAAWKATSETPEIRREIEARFRDRHRATRNAKKRETREFERFMRTLGADGANP